MDRLVGIDYGLKRTGLAASDPLGIFASALDTVDSTKLIDYLKKYAEKERIIRFVVGYPVNLDGRPAEAQAHVDAFITPSMMDSSARIWRNWYQSQAEGNTWPMAMKLPTDL